MRGRNMCIVNLNLRFDFDTQEEYANYKSQQEAMPKVSRPTTLIKIDTIEKIVSRRPTNMG